MYLAAPLMIPHMMRKSRVAIYLAGFSLSTYFLPLFLAVFCLQITPSQLELPSFYAPCVDCSIGRVGPSLGSVGSRVDAPSFGVAAPSPLLVLLLLLLLLLALPFQKVQPSNAHTRLPFVEKVSLLDFWKK